MAENGAVERLLEIIQGDFSDRFGKSTRLASLYKRVRDGTATYAEASDFSIEVGNILAKVFKNKLSSAVLPGGRMGEDMADRILNATLANNHQLISDVCERVQSALNDSAGLGLKTQLPPINQERIDGIIKRLVEAEDYDSIAWILDDPIVNFSQAIVDDFVQANAGFQKELGLRPKITRTLAGHACKWCAALAGTYEYGEEPKDFYRRHENCRCTVTYIPGDGRAQNVWTKKWR